VCTLDLYHKFLRARTQVRLTRNDVLKMTPLAFEGGTDSMTSESCVDFDAWRLTFTDGDFYTCNTFENVLVYFQQTMYMTIPGTCGFSAMQACCSMGGGRKYGTAVMMDTYVVFSNVGENFNHIAQILHCTTHDFENI